MSKIVFIFIVLGVIIGGMVAWQYAKTPSETTIGDTGGIVLDLSGQDLEKIPQSVFSQTALQELNVSHNRLTGAIQAEIRHLANLRVLDLSNNQMTGVPAEIGQLQKLEVLDLSNNKLTGLPYELGNLKNLKRLDISGNQYSRQDLDYIKGKLPSGTVIITQQ